MMMIPQLCSSRSWTRAIRIIYVISFVAVVKIIWWPTSHIESRGENEDFEGISSEFSWQDPWMQETIETYSQKRARDSSDCVEPARFEFFALETLQGKFRCNEIKQFEAQTKTKIGDGLWRQVYSVTDPLTEEDYVIKIVKEAKKGKKALKRHRNEALISTELNTDPENHILNFYGICEDTIVNEYCAMNLEKAILSRDKYPVVPFGLAMKWIHGIAKAIVALHTKMRHTRIVHADLQPRQILLCGNKKEVQVGDYNRARILHRTKEGAYCSFRIPNSKGLYRAPEERLAKSDLDERLDIYSVGLIIFAIFKRAHPWKNVRRQDQAKMLSAPPPLAPKLEIENHWDPRIISLIEDCTAFNREERPNALALLARVESIRSSVSEKCGFLAECAGEPNRLSGDTRDREATIAKYKENYYVSDDVVPINNVVEVAGADDRTEIEVDDSFGAMVKLSGAMELSQDDVVIKDLRDKA